MYQMNSSCAYCSGNCGGLEGVVGNYERKYNFASYEGREASSFSYQGSWLNKRYDAIAFLKNFNNHLNFNLLNNYKNKFDYKHNKINEMLGEFVRTKVNEEYGFVPDDFLRPERVRQKFVGEAEEIKEHIEEAFEEVMGSDFPEDIRIQICSREEFRKLTFNPNILGLALNRKEEGLISDIFVLNDELDRVMLVIGHEIGHVLSRPLKDKREEEAKAFAFSFAWMEKIKEKNIAGLGNSINLELPARNGIHDLAFGFVWRLIKEGKKALEIYWGLIKKPKR